MTTDRLDGAGVLVTRPKHQAGDLAAAIEAEGGNALRFPVLDIVARAESSVLDDVRKLRRPDITIFVSPNAVRFGWPYAADGRTAVIGPATAAAVESTGGSVDIRSSSGYDSEHLLTVDELQDLGGKVVRIVRGSRGRELLADTLRGRGATVEYLPVYERRLPEYLPEEIEALEQSWHSGAIDAITIMSVESLQNFIALMPASCEPLLQDTPLVTPAARVIKEALRRFPGTPTTLASGPSPGDMVEAIVACTQTRAQNPDE